VQCLAMYDSVAYRCCTVMYKASDVVLIDEGYTEGCSPDYVIPQQAHLTRTHRPGGRFYLFEIVCFSNSPSFTKATHKPQLIFYCYSVSYSFITSPQPLIPEYSQKQSGNLAYVPICILAPCNGQTQTKSPNSRRTPSVNGELVQGGDGSDGPLHYDRGAKAPY
jgi:hypothetical protein